MRYWYVCIFFLAILFFVPSEDIIAQESFNREIGFRNDNDVYLLVQQDQYYTNGISFYYKKAVDRTRFSEKWENKIWSFSFGHKIYNAYNGSIDEAWEVDRSITGYLYANGGISWYAKNENVLSVGTEIGVIGAEAFGEEIQKGFHRTFGFYEIKGWEYQLNNSVGIDAYGSYSGLLFRNKPETFDIFLKGTLSLGLNHTGLSFSPYFRLGRINALFESAATGSRIQSKNKKPKRESYFFVSPQFNLILYNSTIEGGMLIQQKGPVTFGIKPFVFAPVIGYQLSTNRIGVNLSYIFNTKEVKSVASAHQYGSFSLAYYFLRGER